METYSKKHIYFIHKTLKAEIKDKLNEYKKNKDELNDYIEMEQFLLREAEREIRSRDAKYVISNFQERVLTIINI